MHMPSHDSSNICTWQQQTLAASQTLQNLSTTITTLCTAVHSITGDPCCCWCSFTLEASFAGPDTGAVAGTHYDTSQLESIGANLALALLDYSDPVQATQAATAMKTAQQIPRQPAAAGHQAPDCDCESSGSLSDGGTVVCKILLSEMSAERWVACNAVCIDLLAKLCALF